MEAMIMSEKVQISAKCEDCGGMFMIGPEQGPNSITNKKEVEIKGQSIFLTYYDCPSCGRRHYVQIDDAVSLVKLNEAKQQFVKLAVAKKKGKEVSKKQLAKFKKTRKDLSIYRTKLMKQFTDECVFIENKEDYERLRFSV